MPGAGVDLEEEVGGEMVVGRIGDVEVAVGGHRGHPQPVRVLRAHRSARRHEHTRRAPATTAALVHQYIGTARSLGLRMRTVASSTASPGQPQVDLEHAPRMRSHSQSRSTGPPSGPSTAPACNVSIVVGESPRTADVLSGPITLTAYDKAVTYIQEETGIGPKALLVKRISQHTADADRSSRDWSFQGQGTFVCPEFEIYDDGHYQIGGLGGGAPQGGDPAVAAWDRASREPGDRRRPAEKKDPVVRRNFADTALWRAAVELGPDGTATTKVTWPESLTTWRLRTYAVTRATQVGDATAEVTTTKNLLVRLQTPRFVEGDEVVLSANVRNTLPTDQQVDIELIVPSALIASTKSAAAAVSGDLPPYRQALGEGRQRHTSRFLGAGTSCRQCHHHRQGGREGRERCHAGDVAGLATRSRA